MLKWLEDLIFPKYCLGCQKEGSYLCPKCREGIGVENSVVCFACGRRSPSGRLCDNCRKKHSSPLAGLLVAADWDNRLLRQVIYAYKYRFVKEIHQPLAELMIKFLETGRPIGWPPTEEIIFIPVPLHPRRQLWRGFNQSELLAKTVAQNLRAKFCPEIVCRTRYSLPQMELADFSSRQRNIKNAFALNARLDQEIPEAFKNKTIVLVDDIATTAATLEECARALKPLKPKEIWGLVIARG